MSHVKTVCLMLVLAGLLTGCAKPPRQQAELTTQSIPSHEVAAGTNQPMPPPLAADGKRTAHAQPVTIAEGGKDDLLTASIGGSGLAGRILRIGSSADLETLRPGEVILTFDDGPNPSVTPKILDVLDKYGVKAVFFMVGKMARAYPETAQLVAQAGHAIGSHSYGHENFMVIGHEAAMKSVARADEEISAALRPVGLKPAPFFRFPYMIETRTIRADLIDLGLVIFGLDIDSWDYLTQTPEQIIKRTLRRLEAKGSGIILFHDIQAHTAKLLPDFLDELAARGYTVVRAVPESRSLLGPITLAAAQ